MAIDFEDFKRMQAEFIFRLISAEYPYSHVTLRASRLYDAAAPSKLTPDTMPGIAALK